MDRLHEWGREGPLAFKLVKPRPGALEAEMKANLLVEQFKSIVPSVHHGRGIDQERLIRDTQLLQLMPK